jgi:hypothetical protein
VVENQVLLAQVMNQERASGLNGLCQGTEVVHPFYSIGTKMMFGSVSEHFASLLHLKRYKTCVSGLNALFLGTKVVKHPFYPI